MSVTCYSLLERLLLSYWKSSVEITDLRTLFSHVSYELTKTEAVANSVLESGIYSALYSNAGIRDFKVDWACMMHAVFRD